MATNRGFYQAKPPTTSGSNAWVSSLRSGPTSQIFGEPPCGRVSQHASNSIGISGEMSHGKELPAFFVLGHGVNASSARSVGHTTSESPTTINSGVGPIRSTKEPGSYSE